MSRPNLFHYATSELSQDAFLAWLLSWSDQCCRDADPALHGLGIAFLSAIFAKCGQKLDLPTAVKVHRQFNAVDVLALVRESHAVLIEDKTDTAEHSNQLARYMAQIQRRFPDRTILPIYLKTGEQSIFATVARAGWQLFLRSELLGILGTYSPPVPTISLATSESTSSRSMMPFVRFVRFLQNSGVGVRGRGSTKRSKPWSTVSGGTSPIRAAALWVSGGPGTTYQAVASTCSLRRLG
jgi:hypothetical protein